MAKKGNNAVQKPKHNLPPGGKIKDFRHGEVLTRIYANKMPWGEIVLKVRQYRVCPQDYSKSLADSFHEEDLQDMMRGAYAAQRWCQKRQRRFRWRVLGWLP